MIVWIVLFAFLNHWQELWATKCGFGLHITFSSGCLSFTILLEEHRTTVWVFIYIYFFFIGLKCHSELQAFWQSSQPPAEEPSQEEPLCQACSLPFSLFLFLHSLSPFHPSIPFVCSTFWLNPPRGALCLSPPSLRPDPALINATSLRTTQPTGEMEALITHPRACYPGSALSAARLFTDSTIVIQLRAQDVRVITEGTRPSGRSPTDKWSSGPHVTEVARRGREWLRSDWHTALAPGLCVREIIYGFLFRSWDECQKWVMTSWKFSFSDRKQ